MWALNRFFTLGTLWHFHKPNSPGLASILIFDDSCRAYPAEDFKSLLKGFFRCVEWQVSHIDIHYLFLLIKVSIHSALNSSCQLHIELVLFFGVVSWRTISSCTLPSPSPTTLIIFPFLLPLWLGIIALASGRSALSRSGAGGCVFASGIVPCSVSCAAACRGKAGHY